MNPSELPPRVRFGPFEVDLSTGELWREGSRISLQEQPFRLLALLLERPAELVTREEMRRRLWPESVFTDFEHGLNKAVNKLRRALGDLADEPRYVETLPRRGYRFVGSVTGATPVRPVAYRLLHEGLTYPLSPGPNLVGRDPASALCLDVSSVSRRHAEIVVSPNGALLRDLASKNGTYLGETRVRDEVPLADGDMIRFGTVRVQFRAVGHESTATASTGANR
jgi:DNA-binding winged helix-turn-helix (wHTH) protein